MSYIWDDDNKGCYFIVDGRYIEFTDVEWDELMCHRKGLRRANWWMGLGVTLMLIPVLGMVGLM